MHGNGHLKVSQTDIYKEMTKTQD